MKKTIKKKNAKRKKFPTKQGDFKVGNKKPPKEHQFKPGQSGNPAGPPKRRTQLWVYFCEYMQMTDSQIAKLARKKLTQAQQTALNIVEKDIPRCSCGRELLPRRRLCTVCAKEHERHRKKRAYHERKNPKPEPIVKEDIKQCKVCGRTRKPGCTYCPKCSRERQRQANRERQRRHSRKTVKCVGLT